MALEMESDSETYVELYIRSLSPRGPRRRQRRVVETLDRLERSGAIAEYTVHVCGKRLPALPAQTQTEFGTYLLNRIAVFEQWAWHNGLSLDSTFERRHVESAVTGEEYTEILVPALALAEYEADALCFVTPVTDAGMGETIAVDRRLDRLATDSAGQGRADKYTAAESLPDAMADPPEKRPHRLAGDLSSR